VTATARKRVQPTAGPRFKAVHAAPAVQKLAPDEKKAICLIAAYADAGQVDPSVRALAERLGMRVAKVDRLLEALEAAGLLAIRWSPWRRLGDACPKAVRRRKNVYALLALGEELPPAAEWEAEIRAIEQRRTAGAELRRQANEFLAATTNNNKTRC
jgi:hypothetical protein